MRCLSCGYGLANERAAACVAALLVLLVGDKLKMIGIAAIPARDGRAGASVVKLFSGRDNPVLIDPHGYVGGDRPAVEPDAAITPATATARRAALPEPAGSFRVNDALSFDLRPDRVAAAHWRASSLPVMI